MGKTKTFKFIIIFYIKLPHNIYKYKFSEFYYEKSIKKQIILKSIAMKVLKYKG